MYGNIYDGEQVYRIHQVRYADRVREAREARLAAQARQPAARRPLAAPALAWLGERLIAWGWRLRARYGAIEVRGS